ncbi:hypothetical protein M011DRAFT_475691 [Sporormia fimetaria CBS 119925]|uniref:Uncharacterized protein n=1 Tax=Sporormia fimetaria CBS 119925 TaxID=1340428 RepID=A0A6A6VI93_9PLEO|nr:hypothetical protein M011DRAFT_475691 [Sporormia fimetaria CBS 119925]
MAERTTPNASSRLKRPLKIGGRTPKVAASSVSAPPKAVVISRKVSKDDVHRRRDAETPSRQTGVRHADSLPSTTVDHQRQTKLTATEAMKNTDAIDESTTRIQGLESALTELRAERDALRNELGRTQHSTTITTCNDCGSLKDGEWRHLTDRLHSAEKEAEDRLRQLQDLKLSISTFTRMAHLLSDGELADRAENLYYRIREWTVRNFRRAEITLGGLFPETARLLERMNPRITIPASQNRLPFLQAVVSHTLVSIFNEDICIGLPGGGPWSSARQLSRLLQDAGPVYQEWRRATVRAIEIGEAKHVVHQQKESLIQSLSESIERHLVSLTTTPFVPDTRTSLAAIVREAAELQQSLLLQKARYTMDYFTHRGHQVLEFDPKRMESVNELDDDSDDDIDMFASRQMSLCIFPCLEKYGNEMGDRSDLRNVLLRAKVFSNPRDIVFEEIAVS